jgi:hypothetical protein
MFGSNFDIVSFEGMNGEVVVIGYNLLLTEDLM